MILFKQQQQMQLLVSPVASLRRLLFLCIFFLIAAAILPTTTNSFPILPSSKSLLPSSVPTKKILSQCPPYHQRAELRQISSVQHRIHSSSPTTISLLSSAADDEINVQLAKARKLIEQAKAKVAAAEAENSKEAATAAAATTTTTATTTSANGNDNKTNTKEEEIRKRKESVIKTQNEETGLITTDGELMAALSETEDWEARSFGDIFADDTDDLIDDGLASRDVAASIFNLRMRLNDADYRRVFDKRNRFIGEDN